MIGEVQSHALACGCDAVGHGPALISVEDALAKISKRVSPVYETEQLGLSQAQGRILAQDVCAKSDLPPFDNSAMDGYTVNTASLSGTGPWSLKVVDRIAAGQAAGVGLEHGTAARIFTGAPIPTGANAVVMQENTERTASEITIRFQPQSGDNIRRAGEELAKGSPILSAGTTLDTRAIAALAASGHGQVTVRRTIRVALLITGDEVQPAGETLTGGGIWDVNTPMLRASLNKPSIELVTVAHCPDDRQQFTDVVQDLSSKVDLLITSGAVSVGEEDHVKPALESLGVDMLFSGVAIKPGKPISVGQVDKLLWVGLPGNPLSALTTWKIFGKAVLKSLCGQTAKAISPQLVQIAAEIHRKCGRTEYRPATLGTSGLTGFKIAHFAQSSHSARVTGLVHADGFITIPAEVDHLPKGALVEFLPFQDA